MALIRRGHHGAFEALVQRYQPRLLAFCRHMLGSREDAEDVLQEVFAAAFNAICADDRPINARPWLYRIARNRCLNHLRRPQPTGQDSMDVFERDGGTTTADTVHQPRGVPPHRGRRAGAPRDAAHRAAAARDRRPHLRADRRGDGHDGAERQVAARARARGARRGRRGAPAHLRRGAARAGQRGRGDRADLRADPPPPEDLRALPDLPLRAAPDLEGARRDLPDRAVPDLQEAVDRQARLRRSGERRRLVVRRRRRGRHGRRSRRRRGRHHRRRRRCRPACPRSPRRPPPGWPPR